MNSMNYARTFALKVLVSVVFMLGVISNRVEADVQQIKFYKEAYPGSKPKCIICHTEKIPKKDEGMHDLNAYGLKIKETDEEITAETYAQVGTVGDFEQQSQQAAEVSGQAEKTEAVTGDEGLEEASDEENETAQ